MAFRKVFAKHVANLLFEMVISVVTKVTPSFFVVGDFLTPSISVCYDRNTVCVGWVVVIFWNSWSTTKWTWVEKQSSNAFQGPQSYVATSATAETHARTCECVWNSSMMYIRCFETLLFVFLKKKIPSMPTSEAISKTNQYSTLYDLGMNNVRSPVKMIVP